MNNNYLMHRSHKYVKKVWKNGSWRYYYDNDSKPDKGFSYKKVNKGNSEINGSAMGIPNSDFKVTSYYVSVGKHNSMSDLFNKENEVSKDIYDHSKSGLFYKNELVEDIAKRKYKEFKKTSSNAIKKGKKFVESLMSKVETLRKKG